MNEYSRHAEVVTLTVPVAINITLRLPHTPHLLRSKADAIELSE